MEELVNTLAAEERHYPDFVRLFAELNTGNAAPTLDEWLAEMARDALVIVERERVVAYGWAHALGPIGYVRHVIVDPLARGRGLGRKVMSELNRRLRAQGCERGQLNVLKHNAVAIALYRSLGFEFDFSTWVVRLPLQNIALLPSSPRSARIRDATPTDELELERTFDLTPGLLATFRGVAGHRVLVLEDSASSQPLGVAHFDPRFPGCWPFRVAEVGFARALLEALAPNIPSTATWIQLVLERDEELAQTMLAADATLQHEIVHMSGVMPSE